MSYAQLAQHRGIQSSLGDIDPIATALAKFITHKTYLPLKRELRASMLPFCPRYYSLSQVLKEDDWPSEARTFMDDAILECGHTMHSILQKWFGAVGNLVGKWECPECKGTAGPLKQGPQVCTTKKCPRRGQEMVYAELELRDKDTGLTAHPDGLWFTPKRVLEGLEFKTIVQDHLDELDEPYETHEKFQAAAYAYLLKQNLDLDVRHFTFVYIARNLPSSFKILFSKKNGEDTKIVAKGYGGKFILCKMFRREIDFDHIHGEFKTIRRVQRVQKKFPNRLLPLNAKLGCAACKDEAEGRERYCPMVTTCFSNRIAARYKTIKTRHLPDLG